MQPDPTHTNNELSSPRQFRAKLGTYLSGVVIGFMMLGMIYLMKHLSSQQGSQPSAQGTQLNQPQQQESSP